ncbi:MAG TPA: polysaccharide biosynthesis protein [Oscillospiraceae bacterium]|nr:polysaccharide biosynthesis protein [Oscillospiraceae bacterium]
MQTQAAPKRKKQSFLHGAIILTASMFLVNVIDAVFKIPLKRIIGTEGFGYFGTAYSLFGPIYSLATAGFPVAISKMVSENYARHHFRDVRQVHRASIPIFVTTGTIGLFIMWACAPVYVNAIHNTNSLPAMYVLAPAIVFSCLSSIYRGYYEGMRDMYPTAISEVIEAICKLAIGLTAAFVVIQIGMHQYHTSGTVFGTVVKSEEYAQSAVTPYAVAASILGVTLGALFSFLFLLHNHRKNGSGFTKQEMADSPVPHTLHYTAVKLIKMAIPIGLGSLALSVGNLIDTSFLITRLGDVMNTHADVLLNMYKGMIPSDIENSRVPNLLYGSYSAASVMFSFVPSITQAFSISALPNVTNAWARGARGELKKNIEAVIRFTALMCIPSGLGLAVLSRPIITLVFGTDLIASRVLVIMGIGVIFASLSLPLYSMLQAIGRVDLPVKLLIVGLTLKVVINYILSGIPEINVLGAGVGTLVCYAFTTVAALYYLCKETHIIPNFVSTLIKPFLASILCAAVAYFVQAFAARVIKDEVATCIAIIIAAIVYAIALLCIKAISQEDILMLPKGQKIAKILEKHNWIG